MSSWYSSYVGRVVQTHYSLVRSDRWQGREGEREGRRGKKRKKKGGQRMSEEWRAALRMLLQKVLTEGSKPTSKGKSFHNNSWATLSNVSNRAVQCLFRDLEVVKFHARMY